MEVQQSLDFNGCVTWARLLFEDYYANSIKQMLYNFPKDYLTASGALFWSGPKRAPTPIEFNVDNPLHFEFIKAAALLRAFNFGIDASQSSDASIKQAALAVMVPEFKPLTNVKIALQDSELNQQQQEGGDASEMD